MTEDRFETVHVDEDGSELSLSPRGLLLATDYNDDGSAERAVVRIPQHAAAALRLALDLGPDAMLRDIAPLLAQCDREDTNPAADQRYLHTREVRVLLGQPVPCGHVEPALGGARCGRDEHGGDTWHVDEKKRLQWRSNGASLDVRGWTVVDGVMPEDGQSKPQGDPVRALAQILDQHGVPVDLDRTASLAFFKTLKKISPFMFSEAQWDAAQQVRQRPRAGER